MGASKSCACSTSGEILPPCSRRRMADGGEPKGDVAIAAILAGSNNKPAWFHHRNGYLSVLRIDGKKVAKTNEIEVGGLPEGAGFTPDGRFLYFVPGALVPRRVHSQDRPIETARFHACRQTLTISDLGGTA